MACNVTNCYVNSEFYCSFQRSTTLRSLDILRLLLTKDAHFIIHSGVCMSTLSSWGAPWVPGIVFGYRNCLFFFFLNLASDFFLCNFRDIVSFEQQSDCFLKAWRSAQIISLLQAHKCYPQAIIKGASQLIRRWLLTTYYVEYTLCLLSLGLYFTF